MTTISAQLEVALKSLEVWSQLVNDAIKVGDEIRESKYKEQEAHFQALVGFLTNKGQWRQVSQSMKPI
jgi:hypothetical protein